VLLYGGEQYSSSECAVTRTLSAALETAARIDAELRAAATPERAVSEKRYLKSDLEFYGCTVWTIRTVARGAWKESQDRNRSALIELVELLWSTPVHDRRMAALELLGAHAGSLELADMELMERLRSTGGRPTRTSG
jgi:hypothetical protein